MKSLEYSRSKSWLRYAIIIAVIATLVYFGKIVYEVVHTTTEVVETVQKAVENVKSSDVTETKTDTRTHGNSNENNAMHIVYEIFGLDAWGAKFSLKVGITAQKNYKTKWGNPRPNLQLKALHNKPEFNRFVKIDYVILDSMVEGRVAAKALEQKYVNEHYAKHQYMPLAQQLPLPEDDIFQN